MHIAMCMGTPHTLLTLYTIPLLQLVWLVVFFAAVFLGMDLGLALGILFSLLILVFRAAL